VETEKRNERRVVNNSSSNPGVSEERGRSPLGGRREGGERRVVEVGSRGSRLIEEVSEVEVARVEEVRGDT